MLKNYFNPNTNPNIYFLIPFFAFLVVAYVYKDWTWALIGIPFLAISINK